MYKIATRILWALSLIDINTSRINKLCDIDLRWNYRFKYIYLDLSKYFLYMIIL